MLLKLFDKKPYHWDNREKAASDFLYLKDLKIKLLKLLAKELNKLHNTNYSVRAWDIMVGYWLMKFLAVSYDRWNIVLNSHDNIKKLHEPLVDSLNLPDDSATAENLFYQDQWNELFIHKLLMYYQTKDTSDLLFKLNEYKENKKKLDKKKNWFAHLNLKKFIYKILNFLFSFFSIKKKNYVFVSSRLSITQFLKIYFLLPGRLYFEPNFDYTISHGHNNNMRDFNLEIQKSDTEFEKIIKYLIPLWVPKSFIEGFFDLKNEKNFLKKLPEKINVIFSANYHFNNDLFKIWLAGKIDKGTKLVCGQHGGGPFHRYNGAADFEIGISDLYASTGNGNTLFKHVRDVGQFFSRLKTNQFKLSGPAMIVSTLMPRYVFDLRSMALGNQMKDYFEEQFYFYDTLPKDIKKKTFIRFPFANKKDDYGWNIYNRWKKRFPDVITQDTNLSFEQSVKSCRLLIHTYNATTFCQSLAANIPTIMFWNIKHWELKEYTNEDMNLLKSVNIFHETAESASNHMKYIWHDISGWWLSPPVQEVRKFFCRKYANKDKFVEKRLVDVLKEVENI